MASLVGSTVCRFKVNNLLGAGLLLLSLAACQAKKETVERLPFYNTADFTAEWIEPPAMKKHKLHVIDTFNLRDQEGQLVSSALLKGKIYAANFFFTSCNSICPKMANNLTKVQAKFIDDPKVQLISFSVMPWKDSVATLKEYAAANGIFAQKWHLLTGNKNRIYNLARQSYFAEKKLGLQKDSTEFLHTETVVLIDPQARIRGIYNATQRFDIDRLIEDIALLKAEQ